MGERYAYGLTDSWVICFNQIIVVYEDNKEVLDATEKFVECVQSKPFNKANSDAKLWDILEKMSKILGYKNIKHSDYGRFYLSRQIEEKLLAETVTNQNAIASSRNIQKKDEIQS